MYISAKAAAESLNTYQSFKDQLLPNIKKGNIAILYPQGYMPDQQQNIGIVKRSKRSKTSFDSHNNSRTSSATGTNSTMVQEQINRSRQTSQGYGFSRKASKSGDCTPFISIDQNVVSKPQIIKKSLRTLNNTDQCFDENYPHPKLPSATTKSHITLIDLEDSSRLKKNNDSLPIERQPKQNTRVNNLSVVDVQATLPNYPHHHPVLSQQTNRAYQQLVMQDTNQELNGLLLSIYDQSDNKSQTCNTVTAENQLREENMQLRMEIIKLKKALFMKSQNNGGSINLLEQVRNKNGADQMLLRNHLEPRDESLANKEPQMTPLTRVVIEDICEEGVSSYSHEDLPRLANSHMTFKQIQQSNSRQYDPEAAVITFQP